MGFEKGSNYNQSEKAHSENMSAPSINENESAFIQAGCGQAGAPFLSAQPAWNIARQIELALGINLDIPSLWRAGWKDPVAQSGPIDLYRPAAVSADPFCFYATGAMRPPLDQPYLPVFFIDTGGAQADRGKDQANPSMERTKVPVESPDFRQRGGPAAIRYNNPGAMYPHESSYKFGSTKSHRIGGGHLIAEFPDAISGAAAQFDLLSGDHYCAMRVGNAITKWCGNYDAAAYRRIVRQAGIDLNASVTETLSDKAKAITLARTMARVEAGREYPLTEAQWQAAYDMFKEYASAMPAHDLPTRPHDLPDNLATHLPDRLSSHHRQRHHHHHHHHH